MTKKNTDSALLLNAAGETYMYSDQVGHLIRKAHQQASAIFQKLSAEPQLTSVQLSVLFALATHGAMAQNRLGKLSAVDPSTLTGVVERLKDRQLIELAAEASDKRKVIISLSADGRTVIKKMASVGHKITETTLKPLSAIERVALVMLLKKLTGSDDE